MPTHLSGAPTPEGSERQLSLDSEAVGEGEWKHFFFLPEALTPFQFKAQNREVYSLEVKNSVFESERFVGKWWYHH